MHKYIISFMIYFLGFFIFSFGVAISIKSGLGVTATTALPLTLSNIFDISVGTMITIMAFIYVFFQIILLKRKFYWINLLQLFFGSLTGIFVDFCLFIMNSLTLGAYSMQILLVLISIPVISLGLTLIINLSIIPSPTEGFILALAKVTKISFPKLKVIVDVITVILSIIIYMIASVPVSGIREGTLLNAIFNGIFIGFFTKKFAVIFKKYNFRKLREINNNMKC